MKRLVTVNADGTEVWEEVNAKLDFLVDPDLYPPLTEEEYEAMLAKCRAGLGNDIKKGNGG